MIKSILVHLDSDARRDQRLHVAATLARRHEARLVGLFPNLAEMRGRPGSQMSGGEQQMLTIARTLMGNPKLVLLKCEECATVYRLPEVLKEAFPA